MISTHDLKRRLLILLFFTLCIYINAQNIYPESSSVRSMLVDSWFMQTTELLRDQSSEVLQNELGEYFLVRAEEKNEIMEIIVAPLVIETLDVQDISTLAEVAAQSPPPSNTSLAIETWPKDGLGSWILYRDVETGENVRVRYYFMNERDVYIEFFPGREKSYASLVIFGAVVAHNAPVPVSFEYFFTASYKDIKKLTQNVLPWEYVDVYENIYTDSMQMVRIIRQILPDAQRAKMFISDTAQYDFLKWIVDGLVRPLTGGELYDEPLYTATVEPNFSIPERQLTHESYDFIRNLAAAALSADTSLSYTFATTNADVKVEPFSLFLTESRELERVNFVLDVGYDVSLLESILYILTATEGDLFYLGAIRELEESRDAGKSSEQYYYNNAAAFFSWFDDKGKFNVSVFENGAEFTLNQFIERYPETYVYLVRVKSSVNFFPEQPEVDEDEMKEEYN